MSTSLDIINSALIKLGQEKITAYPDTTTARGVTASEQYPKALKDLLRAHPWNFADVRTKISADTYVVDYSAVTISDETITQEKHGYVTGQKVQISSDDTLPAPLAASTNYYVIKASVDTFKLASSLANALVGTAINLTTQGAGSHTVTPQDITPEFGFDKQVILPSDFIAMQEVCSTSSATNNIDYKVEGGKILSDSISFYARYTSLVTDPALFPDDFSELLAVKLASDIAYDILNSREKEDSMKAMYQAQLAQVRFQDSRDGTHKPMQVNYFIRQRY